MAQIQYTAGKLIDYAMSLADLQNSQFISYEDKVNLINESYRDIYSRYVESDGDYYCKDVIINVTPAMLEPNTNNNSYLIDLPADFYKVRFVDFNYGGNWVACQHFSSSQRNNVNTTPMYRLKNNKLWIISSPGSFTQIKLTYYPGPQQVDFKHDNIDIEPPASITHPRLISSYFVPEDNQFLCIVADSLTYIMAINLDNPTVHNILATASADTTVWDNLIYHQGKIWFHQYDSVTDPDGAGIIFSAFTDYISPLSLDFFGIGDFAYNFTIQQNWVYWVSKIAGQTQATSLSGGIDGPFYLFKSKDFSLIGADYVYIDFTTTYQLKVNGIIDSQTKALQVCSDDTYFYVLTIDGDVKRYTLTPGGTTLTFVDIIATNVTSMCTQIQDNYLSIVTNSTVYSIYLGFETIFDYPTNDVNEIMAYTCAIGFVRKQSDDKKMSLLTARLSELWERFWSVNKRDEYQFQRINNDYAQSTNNLW